MNTIQINVSAKSAKQLETFREKFQLVSGRAVRCQQRNLFAHTCDQTSIKKPDTIM
jgi:hypothetical protein